MTTSERELFVFLRSGLIDYRPIGIGPDVDWLNVIKVSCEQGVDAISVDGYHKWLENRESGVCALETDASLKVQKYGWLSSVIRTEDSYIQKQRAVNILANILREENLKCVLVKGVSIADYYPIPSHRTWGDIDIYSPVDFDKVDSLLEKSCTSHKANYYRHTKYTLNDISIENHRYLTDIRGQKRWRNLEEDLSNWARQAMAATENPIAYLGVEAMVFFFLYHAQSHFVYESLTLRYFTDWLVILKGEQQALNESWFGDGLKKYHLEKIATVMTAICVHHLGLASEEIPTCLQVKVDSLDVHLEERVLADTLNPIKEGSTANTIKGRLERLHRTFRDAWKIKEFIGVPAWLFAFEKCLGLINCKI